MRMRRLIGVGGTMLGIAAAAGAFSACGGGGSSVDTSTTHVVGKSREEVGKYLIMIGGCNDCHTPGIMQGKELKDIPEDQWLTGSPIGFNGPWGTSYPANLRQKAVAYNEQLFIQTMRKRDERPPMPWAALHAMSDEDLGAILAYIKSLPVTGAPSIDPLPAGKEPPQPFIVMVPGISPPLGAGSASSMPASAPK